MSGGSLPLVCALICASAVAALGSSLSDAAEPAQRVVRLGFVGPASPTTDPRGIVAFKERLRELGYIEGKNLVIEERWAEGRFDRLPALMAEVIAQHVDLLVTYGTPARMAAKNATNTLPIVVAVMGDAVRSRLVESLARQELGWTEGRNLVIESRWAEGHEERLPALSRELIETKVDCHSRHWDG